MHVECDHGFSSVVASPQGFCRTRHLASSASTVLHALARTCFLARHARASSTRSPSSKPKLRRGYWRHGGAAGACFVRSFPRLICWCVVRHSGYSVLAGRKSGQARTHSRDPFKTILVLSTSLAPRQSRFAARPPRKVDHYLRNAVRIAAKALEADQRKFEQLIDETLSPRPEQRSHSWLTTVYVTRPLGRRNFGSLVGKGHTWTLMRPGLIQHCLRRRGVSVGVWRIGVSPDK